jgi:hypothetical protein
MAKVQFGNVWYEVTEVVFDAENYLAKFISNGTTYVLVRPTANDPQQWVKFLGSAGSAAGLGTTFMGPIGGLITGVIGAGAYLLKNATDEGYYPLVNGKLGEKKFDVLGIQKHQSKRFQW